MVNFERRKTSQGATGAWPEGKTSGILALHATDDSILISRISFVKLIPVLPHPPPAGILLESRNRKEAYDG